MVRYKAYLFNFIVDTLIVFLLIRKWFNQSVFKQKKLAKKNFDQTARLDL